MKFTKWLYTSLASGVAGFAAARLVHLAWRFVSGKQAPDDSEDMAVSTAQATVFAALAAAAVAAAQTLATRKALGLLARSEAKDLASD
jgi:hypothetical protein